MTSTARTTFFALILLAAAWLPAMAKDTPPPTTFDVVVENYLTIQSALAGDTLEGVAVAAGVISENVAALAADFDARRAGTDDASAEIVTALLPDLDKAARSLVTARSVKAARSAFGDLSTAMIGYRDHVAGVVPHVAYCPMAKKSWLQNGKTIMNPYYGSSMLHCGSIVED